MLAAGAAAPAFAASPCPTIPAFATPAWSTPTTSGSSVSGTGGYGFSGGNFSQSLDAARNSTFTVTSSTPIAVVAGTTYTFAIPFTAYVVNTRAMTTYLRINGVNIPGAPHVDTGILSPNGGSTTSYTGTNTASYVATSTGTVSLSVSFEITTPNSNTTAGDDMVVRPLTVTCL